jgi:ferredoxin-nitrite reductase
MNMKRSWADRENLNQNERAKLEKDGLEILKELDRLAQMKYEDIDRFDIERMKWAGIYTQRPKNGRFLVRIKLASGELTADQADVIAGISRDFGARSIQITIRQCIQIHNLTLPDIPEVFARMQAAGLTSVEGCGDVPRNILGNPLMGIDPEERVDTQPIVRETARRLVGNPAYSNLPRKYKISISSNPHDCGFARINDVAFVPAEKEKDGVMEQGFHMYVGGGLSTDPKLAKKTGFVLRPDQVAPAAEAVAEVFREYGYREKRNHCRLKFLVEDWGIRKTEEAIERITGPLERGGTAVSGSWNRGCFFGVHPQKQEGLFYAGVHIPAGAMDAEDLAEFARLARVYGSGRMRTTNSQNLLLIDLPEQAAEALKKEPVLRKFPLQPKAFTGYCASCTGNQYCSFAPIETKKRLQTIVEALDARFPALRMPMRVNLTGCAHSCAHPQLADFGLTGGKRKGNGVSADVFRLTVGGALGPGGAFGTTLEGWLPADTAADAIGEMVQYYLEHKKSGERFFRFVRRQGTGVFQEILNRYTTAAENA